jgi:hypothetical protein
MAGETSKIEFIQGMTGLFQVGVEKPPRGAHIGVLIEVPVQKEKWQ